MQLPQPIFDPPFRITRASHIVHEVVDLAASRRFYVEVGGMVVTAEEDDTLYLRGIEEACHHSLVLKRAVQGGGCRRIGFRVQQDRDLDLAYEWFGEAGCPVDWVQVPHQDRTLQVTDPSGMLLEFCASMAVVDRRIVAFRQHKGGRALRLDHFQTMTPHLVEQCHFYARLGFRVSEYIVDARGEPTAIFMQVKGNSHDFVFVRGAGPSVHHFAYMTPDNQSVVLACDVAGEAGYGEHVERGPGRHGPGHAMYVYMRDPDGHRFELTNTTYQTMDVELAPVRWDRNNSTVVAQWGLPAQASWFEATSPFVGMPQEAPVPPPNPMTLEKFLAAKA